jgi:hypothetical protein
MNETDILIEYSRRYQFAKYCQYFAAPIFLLSIAILGTSKGAFGTPGEKIFVLAGGALLIASLALAVLSVDRYRCPYCNKSLGVTRNIKFCPYCGVNVQPVDEIGLADSSNASVERSGFFRRIATNFLPARGISRPAASRPLTEGNYRPLASDFPEETYPKNIRMFTTSDEVELTKRYIRLITKDESAQTENPPLAVEGARPEFGRRQETKAPEDAPGWRNKKKTK